MRTMRIFASACILSVVVFLSSCDWLFSEDYGTKGFLSATLSDNGVLPAMPEGIQVRYYDNYSNEEYTEKLGEPDCFASDGNFLSRIRTGEYRFLAYSTFNNKVRNSSDITQIEIYADTVNSEKYGVPVYANKLRPVHMASESGFIFPEDTTYRTFALVPMVQKIVINITLKGMSAEHEIETLEAMLSGVVTGRKIYTNQPIAEYAGIIFPIFTETDTQYKYTSEAYVFGVSNTVQNMLRVECVGDTFTQYSQVDLSSVLKDFSTDGIVIDVVIEIGENMQMDNIYIDAWKDIEQDDINFNN